MSSRYTTIADSHPFVDLSGLATPGLSICISGANRSGKTSLQEWLAWAHILGFDQDIKPDEVETTAAEYRHLRIFPHIVIARDYGSFAWLALCNPPYNFKLRIYIPHGAKFEPDRRQVQGNIEVIEFDPGDLGELAKKLIDDSTQQILRVIEFDCYCPDDIVKRARFWRMLIKEIIDAKKHHKSGFPICLILDEWQQVTVSRGVMSTAFKELRKESEVITYNIVADAAKYRVRLIISVNPLKAMDSRLLGQFAYFFFKHMMTEEHLDSSPKKLVALTQNCDWNHVVIKHNRAPEGYNRFPWKMIGSRSDIDVDHEAPKESLRLEDEATISDLTSLRSHVHNVKLIEALEGKLIYDERTKTWMKLGLPQIASLMGHKAGQNVSGYKRTWRKQGEKHGLLDPLPDPQRKLIPVEPPKPRQETNPLDPKELSAFTDGVPIEEGNIVDSKPNESKTKNDSNDKEHDSSDS